MTNLDNYISDDHNDLRTVRDLVAERDALRALLVELARWSRVAELNGDLHARIASALARAAQDDGRYESWWLIERPGKSSGRPEYWSAPTGIWTDDPWRATRYEFELTAQRSLARIWFRGIGAATPSVVEHGFWVENA